ncbi:hypothetical protein ACPA9J_18660 [Pseudomonas aeruginosa]
MKFEFLMVGAYAITVMAPSLHSLIRTVIMKLERNPDFEILRSSDVRYEHLTTEVQYKGEPVAQINQDKGKENLELEIFADLKDAV